MDSHINSIHLRFLGDENPENPENPKISEASLIQ